MARGHQGAAGVGSAAVLPDNGAVDGFARAPVPHHGGFALVGNAHGGQLLWLHARLGQHLRDGGRLRGPDFLRVVFHPTRGREVLREFLLRHGDDAAVVVEQDGAGTGGALVQGEDVAAHGAP